MQVEPRVRELQAANVNARQFFARGIRAPYRLLQMSERRWPEALEHPAHIVFVGDAPHVAHDRLPRRRRKTRQEPPVALRPHQLLHHLSSRGSDQIEYGLAVL